MHKKIILFILSFFLITCINISYGEVPTHEGDADVIAWVDKIIRPFFLSDNKDKIAAWFSKDAFEEAIKIKETLSVKHFGKIDIEQKATIDGVPAWRITIAVRAAEEKDQIHDFVIRLLILRNNNGGFKINHIDRNEMKLTPEKL